MPRRDEIIKFCEDYLKVNEFEDYCVNGLQVEGKKEIKKIITGVSLSQKLIQEAIKEKADMIMVHHGIFVKQIGTPPKIEGYIKERIKLLLENDINLAGFHLPLDAHPEIGNNISLAKKLKLSNIKPFDIGFLGELKKEIDFTELVGFIKENFSSHPYSIQGGPKKVKKIGVVSGGAAYDFQEALKNGADTFITGEPTEFVVRAVEESKINFIAAGHYQTEKDGVYNLGELIKKEFGVEHKFIDIPCDV